MTQSFIERAGGGLHPHLFQFALEPFQFVFLGCQFGAKPFGEAAARGSRCKLRDHLSQFKVAAEGVERTQPADGLDAAHARGDSAFAGQLEQADFAGGRGVRATA